MNPATTRGISRGWTVLGPDGGMVGTVADVTSETLFVERFDKGGTVEEIAAQAIDTARDGVVRLLTSPDDGLAMSEQQHGVGESATTDSRVSELSAEEAPLVVRLHEEELQAQKQVREAGALTVRKEVVEEERALDVPIVREQVEVTRQPVDRPFEGSQRVFTEGDTVRFLMIEERVEVRKVPWVVEEVVIRRLRTEDVQRVVETVRREELTIDQEGAVRTASGDQPTD